MTHCSYLLSKSELRWQHDGGLILLLISFFLNYGIIVVFKMNS